MVIGPDDDVYALGIVFGGSFKESRCSHDMLRSCCFELLIASKGLLFIFLLLLFFWMCASLISTFAPDIILFHSLGITGIILVITYSPSQKNIFSGGHKKMKINKK
jgi:hypothetical protein